jgi:hypothetical protein
MSFDLQRILDANGFSIALTGLIIVFVALGLIALVIAALPPVLRWLDRWLPESGEHRDVSGHGVSGHGVSGHEVSGYVSQAVLHRFAHDATGSSSSASIASDRGGACGPSDALGPEKVAAIASVIHRRKSALRASKE